MIKSHSRRLWVVSFLAIEICSTICCAEKQGKGYLFYKEESFYPDSKASVTEVVAYESFLKISRAKTKSGAVLQVTTEQNPEFLPDPNGSGAPDDVGQQIKELIVRYPQHRILLEKLLAVCKSKIVVNPAVGSASTKQPEYKVVMLDGTETSNANISRITDEGFSITSASGIQSIKYGVIDLDLSNLPPEAMAAIAKVKAVEAKRKAEADRVASEKKEQERIAKEAAADTQSSNSVNQSFPSPSTDTALERKLKTLIFPKVDFRDATLREVIDFIRTRSWQLDPQGDPIGKGININLTGDAATESENVRVTILFSGIPLGELLKHIAGEAKLKLIVTAEGVVFDVPSTESEAIPQEAKRLTKGAELQRLAGVEQDRLKKEAEQQRLAQIESEKLQKEDEIKRIAEEQRLAAQEVERQNAVLATNSTTSSGADLASTKSPQSTWDRFASLFSKKTDRQNNVKYYPKVLAVLDALSKLETECQNVIAAFPDGKPLDAPPILQAQVQSMSKSEANIDKAINSLRGDSTLIIDSRVSSAIEAYYKRAWKAGTNEHYLLQDVQALKVAIKSAGASASSTVSSSVGWFSNSKVSYYQTGREIGSVLNAKIYSAKDINAIQSYTEDRIKQMKQEELRKRKIPYPPTTEQEALFQLGIAETLYGSSR